MSESCLDVNIQQNEAVVTTAISVIEVDAGRPDMVVEVNCEPLALEFFTAPTQLEFSAAVTTELVTERFDVYVETTPVGAKGDRGLPGAPGEGRVELFNVAATVGGHRVVFFDDTAGGVKHADSTDATHAFRIAGVTEHAAVAGSNVTVRQGGSMQDVSLSFTPGEQVFFTSSGVLTHTPPSTGFRLRVGYALATDVLFVDFGIPVFI